MENTSKEYVAQMQFECADPASVFKLDIQYIEEEYGGGTIRIEWDEEDADLQWWNNLGEEKQQQFILDALTVAISNALDKDESNKH
jgi:hypothetical protein